MITISLALFIILIAGLIVLTVALTITMFLWRKSCKKNKNQLSQQTKTMEQTIKERNAVISPIFSNVPFQFWICDESGYFLYNNKAFAETWGNCLGKNIANITIDQRIKQSWIDNHARALLGKTITKEVSYRIGDKQHHFIEVLTPLYIDNNAAGMLGTHIDITSQKEAELSTKASEKKFHSIFNNSPDTISLVDYETGQYVDINTCFLTNTGKKRSEIIGKTRQELNVWADENERERYESLLFNKHSVQNFEMQWNIAGGVRQFLVSSEIIELDGRKTILTISKDVEELYKLQKALAQSEKKFRTIFNASSDGIIITSLDNKFIEANDAFLRISGFSREQLNQYTNMQLVHPEYHATITSRLAQMIEGKKISPIELEVFSQTKCNWIELNSCVMEYNNTQVILSHVRDIQERKELSQQTLKLIVETEENERRRLAYDLHDDVGPLLSSLNMYVSLLARRPEIEKYAIDINNIQVILKETIGAVRAISNNISPHVLKTYGLSAAVKNFFEANSQLIDIKLYNDFENQRFPEAIEITLYRIIKELLNNTIKYAKASNCELSLRNIENKIVFCYSDNGCGFDWDETLETSKKNLGLTSIINRVRTMNGSFSVETAPDKGFKMTIIVKQ